MGEKKALNKWIGEHYKGLSSHTLVEFLKLYFIDPLYVDFIVYVEIYTCMITGKKTDLYYAVLDLVNQCDWL